MVKLLRNPLFYLILILIVGAVIRLYRLEDYVLFLGDEGRDVLVVKEIITDHKFTLLGPTASVGGFYTGPIYYYFMLPFLWASNLNPVGPVYMSVLFGLGVIVLTYFLCSKLFNKKVALIAAFLTAISPKLVEISRFSWNPNPVPFFTILSLILLYYAVVSKKRLLTFLCGVCVGIVFQLHYINLVFVAAIGLMMLSVFPKKEWLYQSILLCLGFLLGDLLYILFEIRHGFPNIISVIVFLTRPSAVSPRELNPITLILNIAVKLYDVMFRMGLNMSKLFLGFTFLATLYWSFKNYKQKTLSVKIILIWFVIGCLGVGFYRGSLLEHYFAFMFVIPIIFVSILLSYFLNDKKTWLLFIAGVALFIFFSIKNMYFWYQPNLMINQTKSVDKIVMELIGNESFNFAIGTPGNSDHAYRYFLEIWGKRPVTIMDPIADPKRESITNQLIVVCEQKCSPQGISTWEIAGFGRAEIEKKVDGPAGITVYKLVHYYGT